MVRNIAQEEPVGLDGCFSEAHCRTDLAVQQTAALRSLLGYAIGVRTVLRWPAPVRCRSIAAMPGFLVAWSDARDVHFCTWARCLGGEMPSSCHSWNPSVPGSGFHASSRPGERRAIGRPTTSACLIRVGAQSARRHAHHLQPFASALRCAFAIKLAGSTL